MAALLRQGARRIGGSVLQRTQAAVTSPAVAEERRRLLPRRMYFTQKQAVPELSRQIQKKKEELYDVLCKAEQNFWTSSLRNKLILQHLSRQVKPRPADTKWQIMRFAKMAVNVVDAAGLIVLTGVVGSFVLDVGKNILETRAYWAMMREEEDLDRAKRSGEKIWPDGELVLTQEEEAKTEDRQDSI